MLGLPKSTSLSREIPKAALFTKLKPTAAERTLLDSQIDSLTIVAEISSQTLNLIATPEISAIYLVAIALNSPQCAPKNIAILSKLIDQNMLFVLQYQESAQLAVYYADKVLLSEQKHVDTWDLKLKGYDLGTVWENLIAQVIGFERIDHKGLYQIIAEHEQHKKLLKQISTLEKKAWSEKQPRRKWEYDQELRLLKEQLKEYGTHE
jgi:hypothetical protein